MRLIEFESSPTIYINDKAKILNILHEQCSDIFNLCQKNNAYLYRGSYDNENAFSFLSKSPEDRSPSLSNVEISDKIDDKLEEAGFTALRSNSIFCSGSKTQARLYGALFIIFPINGFTYTWSSKIRDLTIDLRITNAAIEDYIFSKNRFDLSAEELITADTFKSLKLQPKEFITKYQFKKYNLLDALKSGHEIYIHGNYFALNYKNYNEILYENK